MALIDSAVNGLLGAVVAGGVSVALWWRGRPKRSQLDDAWRKQANDLDRRLTQQHKADTDWLREQLAACQAETRRLNQLLNRKRRAADD